MTYEDYLIHSFELQHGFWKKPKFFKKDKGRYFYSKREWDAYVRNKNNGRKISDRTKKDVGVERSNREDYNSRLIKKEKRIESQSHIGKIDRSDADREIALISSERRGNLNRIKNIDKEYALAKDPWYDRISRKVEAVSFSLGDSFRKVIDLSRKKIEMGKDRAKDIISKGLSKLSEKKAEIESGLSIFNSIWRVNIRNPKEMHEIREENKRINATYNRRDTGVYRQEDDRVQRRAKGSRTYQGPNNWFGKKGSYSDPRNVGANAVDYSNGLLAYAKKASELERKELEKDLEKLRKKYLY